MDTYNDQAFALVYCLSRGSFEIHALKNLAWRMDMFHEFVHGGRFYTTLTVQNDSENVLILQTSGNTESLKETKHYCIAMKKKKKAVEYIRGLFKPLRGKKRQHLSPVEVSLHILMFSLTFLLKASHFIPQ